MVSLAEKGGADRKKGENGVNPIYKTQFLPLENTDGNSTHLPGLLCPRTGKTPSFMMIILCFGMALHKSRPIDLHGHPHCEHI